MTPRPPHQVIRASAGTGKTFALSSQYLRLLFRGAGAESILATTFTRKATGEILARVLQRLAGAAGDRDAAARLARELREPELSLADARRMLQALAQSLHRVSVSTIDSFFNRMGQSFRLELGLPQDPKMVAGDDPLAAQVRREAIDALLAEAEPRVMVDLLRRAHHDAARRSVTQAIDQIVANLHEVYRQAPDAAAWSRLQAPPPVEEQEVRGALRVLIDAAGGVVNKSVAKALTNNVEAAMEADWPRFLSNGVAAKVAAGEHEFSRWVIPGQIADAMRLLIRQAEARLIGGLAQQTQATYELLQRFDGHFARFARAQRVVLFSDLPYALARGLPELSDPGAPGLDELYYRLDSRVRHLLLDEFQDTSPLQWEVLRPLAEEVAAHGDGTRSFFCVGDVKQAIYGWRGGCAELFDLVESELHLPHEARARLNVSYRSSQTVLAAVNGVFLPLESSPAFARDERLKAIASAWRGDFVEHTAHHAEAPGYVELMTSPAPPPEEQQEELQEDAPADELIAPPASTHQAFVAQRVAQLAGASPGKTIGVLVSTNAAVNQLIHLLREAGVGASGEGGNPVTDDPAVGAVLAAIRLADHPGDTAAAFQVISSPLGPILKLSSYDLRETAGLSLRLRGRLATEGYAGLIAEWARRLAPHCDRRNVVRLGQLVQLADDFQPQATLRPGDFGRFVAAARVEEPNPAAVRVMTVHKAKGLEFDLVVLPELDRDLGTGNRSLVFVVRDHPTAGVKAVYRYASKEVRALSPELEDGYWQERARRLRDDLCALYVAMTRAKSALHMIVKPLKATKAGGPGVRGRSNLSYATILRGALSAVAEEDMAGGQTLYRAGPADWAGPPAAPAGLLTAPPPLRLELARGQATRSWRIVTPSSLEAGSRVSAADLMSLETTEGRLRGTVIHALFEAIKYLPGPGEDELLTKAGKASPQAEAAVLKRWVAEFQQMLLRPEVIECLTEPPGENDVWQERAFAVRDAAGLVKGTFDRVVIRKSAGRAASARLTDFKTDRIDPNDPQSRAIEARYGPQLEAYKRALASMLGLEASAVRAELLLVGDTR